jgi:uncharacterized protein (DUF2141 family)
MIKGLILALSTIMLPLSVPGDYDATTFNKNAGTLNLEIKNIKNKKGKIIVTVFDNQRSFLKKGEEIPVRISKTGNITVALDDLTYGKYAISIFHDVNNNGKLDTNFFGIPEEPYGFSNNVRPKFRAPKYTESVFAFGSEGQNINIKLGSAF